MHPKQTETRLYYKYRGTGQKISGRAVGPILLLVRRTTTGPKSNLPRRVLSFHHPETNTGSKPKERGIANRRSLIAGSRQRDASPSQKTEGRESEEPRKSKEDQEKEKKEEEKKKKKKKKQT